MLNHDSYSFSIKNKNRSIIFNFVIAFFFNKKIQLSKSDYTLEQEF